MKMHTSENMSTEAKVYYVIRSTVVTDYYFDGRMFANVSVDKALRADSVAALLNAVCPRLTDRGQPRLTGPGEIVRVEETRAGSQQIVITNRTKIDATKPCVVEIHYPEFGPDVHNYAKLPSLDCWTGVLQHATVFTDLSDALLALSARRAFLLNPELKVFNVETRTSEPTYKLTVLE